MTSPQTQQSPQTRHLTDAELATQPAAYWTRLAYEATIAYTRARIFELGYSQPQLWLLRNLSKNDLSPDGHGMTIPELQQAMRTYIRPEDDLEAEAADLLERGWLTHGDGGRLWITERGEETRASFRQYVPAIRDGIHQGIDEADYVTTLKVLQQMIWNTDGTL